VKCGWWRGSWHTMRALLASRIVVVTTLTAFAQQPTSEQISAIRASCRSDFMAQCAGVQPSTWDALECLKRNAAKVSPSCKAALDAVGSRPTESAAPAPAPAAPAPAPHATAPEPAAAAPASPAAAEPAAAAAEPAAPPPRDPAAVEDRKSPPSPIAAVRTACRADFGVHCPGVRPGDSAALRCLQANAAALSPPCPEAVMATGEGRAPPPAGAAAASPVAPPGPIPPMRPRRALEILSFCEPEVRTLCADVPPGGGRILECLAENYARLSPQCYGALGRATR
jgi:hypothetical protein